jgi:hypothetical protein
MSIGDLVAPEPRASPAAGAADVPAAPAATSFAVDAMSRYPIW